VKFADVPSAVVKALEFAGVEVPVNVTADPSPGAGRDVICTVDKAGVKVTIFPSLCLDDSFEAIHAVLVEVGWALLKDRNLTEVWDRKLAFVDPAHVDDFQLKLSSTEYNSFADLVKSTNNAVPRLTAIHLSNGLIHSGYNPKTGANIDVKSWGTTSQLATGKLPFSLIPLTSLYCKANTELNFGYAFADLVLCDLGSVSESTVKAALKKLILSIVNSGTSAN